MLMNIKRRISFVMVVLTVSAAMLESTAWPQPNAQTQSLEKPARIPDSISTDIGLDQLKAKRASVEGAAGPDTDNKKNILNLLDKAIQLREHSDRIIRQKDEISQTIKDARLYQQHQQLVSRGAQVEPADKQRV